MFKEKKLTKSAFTYAGYEKLKIVKKEAEKLSKLTFWQKLFPWTAPKPILKPEKFTIYAGPLKKGDKEIAELLPEMDPGSLPQEYRKIVEDQWTPNPQLTVYDHVEKKALTAVEAEEKRHANQRWMPMYFQNPLQGYDYIVYESLVKNSLLGPVMKTLVKFIMGTGFRPELELKIPTNDEKADAELIAKNEEIISRLLQVDRAVTEKSGVEGIDISFRVKMTNMIQNMLIFNRACAVFVYDADNPIVIDGKKYPNIPVNLVDFHPRDMGLVKISPQSHKMVALQINQISGFVKTEEMIYLWNSEYAAPIWNSKYYGGSMMMPLIDPARVIRSTISSIFPAINENMVGGLYHIFIEPQGGTEAQKKEEYESITTSTEFGTSNVFMISPDRVKYENVNFDPKIGELIEMFDTLVKYVIANANVPQIGFYDEAAANHACYSEDTQTLTENGWKYYWEITHGEKIATFNPKNDQIEFYKPIGGLHLYDYNGDMISFKSERQDILVTPNHKMWVHNASGWKKRDARDLINLKKVEFRAHGNYDHEELKYLELEPVEYPLCHNQPQIQIQTIEMDTWLEFLGYYIAEGTKSHTSSRYHIALVQRKGDSADKIQKCLDKLPFKFGSYTDREIYIRWQKDNKQLHKALEQTGRDHTSKQIPHWILKNCSKRQLQILFDSLMLGDGTVDKRPNRTNMEYVTTSSQLADDMQELAIKLGFFARIKKQLDKRENRNVVYRIRISKPSQLHIEQISKQRYNGKVYCFGVPNHLFITRRNGQPTIQGNTAVEKIQLTISTVINPMREWIGDEIARQWYNRIFVALYEKNKKIVNTFKIKVAFDDLQVETLKERAEGLEILERRVKLSNEKAGEILQIDGYEDSIDVESEPVPPNEEFEVSNKNTNEKFKVKTNVPGTKR